MLTAPFRSGPFDPPRGSHREVEPGASLDEAGRALGRVARGVGAAMGVPSEALEGPMAPDVGDGESSRSPGGDAEPRGPDRLRDMPGGAEAVLRRRRERRRELMKEGANVGVGAVVASLVTTVVVIEAGGGLGLSLALGLAAAGSWGWILGREVVADLVRNSELLHRERDRW